MDMLKEVLSEVWLQEYTIPEETAHEFSSRHCEKMQKIFSRKFGRMSHKRTKKLSVRKRVLIACVMIFLASCGIVAGAAVYNSFSHKDYSDHTELFAVNAENCPKTIEYVYYLPEIPEGYILSEQIISVKSVYTTYFKNNRGMTFEQYVKEDYYKYFDNERSASEEFEIDNHTAIYWYVKNSKSNFGSVVWDHGDYILEVGGDFTKDELVELLKSVKKS